MHKLHWRRKKKGMSQFLNISLLSFPIVFCCKRNHIECHFPDSLINMMPIPSSTENNKVVTRLHQGQKYTLKRIAAMCQWHPPKELWNNGHGRVSWKVFDARVKLSPRKTEQQVRQHEEGKYRVITNPPCARPASWKVEDKKDWRHRQRNGLSKKLNQRCSLKLDRGEGE